MSSKILYISYDGMTDPLGQSQVIPYLEGLAKLGSNITLLSFEKRERFKKNASYIQAILDKEGIRWRPMLFSTRPPILSKLYDVWRLKRIVRKLHRKENFDFIHCRSYVAAAAGLEMKKRYNVPFLFDMRGFWVDERVDNGQWDLSKPLYRFFYKMYKKKEKTYFSEARHIISLTWKGKEELINAYGVPPAKITVIPCCVDLQHFNYSKIAEADIRKKKQDLGIDSGETLITYLGSLGSWYMVKEMLEFFAEMKKDIPRAKFLFVTQDQPASVFQMATLSNVDRNSVIVKAASRNEVPLYLAVSDFSIFFIKDAYSKRASSPTKQGEIMAMGIPLICNDIGDTGKIIESAKTGALTREFNIPAYNKITKQLPALQALKREDIRAAAFEYYDLEKGIKEYSIVYKTITG
jgi:glycosyltransferase involved in cell wall biosynthesis